LNADGQPSNPAFNSAQNMGKSLDALYGMCRGILIDGEVSENECACLDAWLTSNPSVVDMWPADVIAKRLGEVLHDGVVSPEEASDIRDLLEKAIGGRPSVDDGVTLATRLPLTEPFPEVKFKNQTFCFTGKFAYGTRAKCRDAVHARGGVVEERVSGSLDYLVIGTIASRDWAHTSHGRKIEAARGRSGAKIVSEEHWVRFL
jgi:NAD-dependent DNA ligase